MKTRDLMKFARALVLRMAVMVPVTLLLVAGVNLGSGEVQDYWPIQIAIWATAPFWELMWPTLK